MNGSSETRKRRTGINKDLFVFAFFLFLSFIFWYLNSLNKEVEAGIRYQVRYTNLPRGREVSESEPGRLNLYLKGRGSSVIRQKLSGKKMPLAIDISKVNYKRVPGSKEPDYYIVTSGLARSFAVQLRSEFDIISIKPDTLYFTLQKATAPVEEDSGRSFFRRKSNPGINGK
ncbi:MAG TPA: hypothetical protein VK213_11475 [Bacteroidales bacterium]|nr:hypothetical protein [Bacteroidales bacterium]